MLPVGENGLIPGLQTGVSNLRNMMTTYVQSECGLSVKAQEILTVLKAVSGDPRTEGFLEEYKGPTFMWLFNIYSKPE